MENLGESELKNCSEFNHVKKIQRFTNSSLAELWAYHIKSSGIS